MSHNVRSGEARFVVATETKRNMPPRGCYECGHSSDWHSAEVEGYVGPGTEFPCNGPGLKGCNVSCKNMIEPPRDLMPTAFSRKEGSC